VGLVAASYNTPSAQIVRPGQAFDSRDFGLRSGTGGVDWRSNIARRGLGGGTEGTSQGSEDETFALSMSLSDGDPHKDLLAGLGWNRRTFPKGILSEGPSGEPLGTWSKKFSKGDTEAVAAHALDVNESMGLSLADVTVERKSFTLRT
jgi:hypothetical protein